MLSSSEVVNLLFTLCLINKSILMLGGFEQLEQAYNVMLSPLAINSYFAVTILPQFAPHEDFWGTTGRIKGAFLALDASLPPT